LKEWKKNCRNIKKHAEGDMKWCVDCLNRFFVYFTVWSLSAAIFLLSALPSRALAEDPTGAEKIPVLSYHEVLLEPNGSDVSNVSVIAQKMFAEQMEYLHNNGYCTASMSELEGFVKDGRKLPPKTVVISFDDGYQSNYLYAFPYLAKYGFKATLNLIGNVPQDARPHLTGFQLMAMVRSGLVEIECHTYDLHREIDGIPALMVLPEQDIYRDFTIFNALCQKMGIKKPSAIAYPYGIAGAAAKEAAAGVGYRMGFTITGGYVRPGDPVMSLKRFNIGPDIDMNSFAAIVSGTAM
jgi:peptidoglycan/xylan/chitin deacetylase (PgdA/CDA1 family)